MKAIKFADTDSAGFNALQQKIHNYLSSNLSGYSANKYADVNLSLHCSTEKKYALIIDENPKRYSLILEALTHAEIDSIETIPNSWGSE
jgi:hypothetical protein